jgi:hypothetical protein
MPPGGGDPNTDGKTSFTPAIMKRSQQPSVCSISFYNKVWHRTLDGRYERHTGTEGCRIFWSPEGCSRNGCTPLRWEWTVC